MSSALSNKNIAIPESRQLDNLARLLEKKQVNVLRCPLVAIHDSPEEEKVLAWLNNFIQSPPDDFIILTGEGIHRLTALSERHGLKESWANALMQTRKIARGPKPGKALRVLSLRADLLGVQPTTEGIIETLDELDLTNRKISVQLYGDNPNQKLMGYLNNRNVNHDKVSPYIYASESETEIVIGFIDKLIENEIDMICFTSQSQLKRLHSVAKKHDVFVEMQKALKKIHITSVGPTMTSLLEQEGYEVAVQPSENFYMGDMVRAIEAYYEKY